MEPFPKPLEVHTRAARKHLFVGRFVEPDVNCWRAAVWGLVGRNPAIAREALVRLERMPEEGERAYLVDAALLPLPHRRLEALFLGVYHSPLIHRLFKLRMHERRGPGGAANRRQWKVLVQSSRQAVLVAVERTAMRYMNPLRARAVAVAFAENYGTFLQALHLRRLHGRRHLSTI